VVTPTEIPDIATLSAPNGAIAATLEELILHVPEGVVSERMELPYEYDA